VRPRGSHITSEEATVTDQSEKSSYLLESTASSEWSKRTRVTSLTHHYVVTSRTEIQKTSRKLLMPSSHRPRRRRDKTLEFCLVGRC